MMHLLSHFLDSASHPDRRVSELDDIVALKDRDNNGTLRGMSWGESGDYHLDVWDLKGGSHPHEPTHQLFGLARKRIYGRVLPGQYQGDFTSEIFVVPMTFITQGIFDIGKIQNDDIAAGSAQRSAEWEKKTGKLQKFFGEALYDKNLFIDEVRHTYRENYASETAGRILNWAIGQKTGMTTDQIKIASRYGEGLLDSLAAKHGIKVTRDHKTNSLILMTDDTVYQVNVPGEADRLPQGSNGVENFKPFVAPSDHEIGLIHDHIMPAIKYMHDVAVRYGPDMVARTVTMDKLYDLMKPERTLSLSKIWSGITRGLSALKGIKKQKTPVAHASF